MLRYQGYAVSCQEVPGEISVVLLIAGCKRSCQGCHSPELQLTDGRSLNNDLMDLLYKYNGLASCVCFMGEGGDMNALISQLHIAQCFGYKTCLYSGSDSVSDVAPAIPLLDYLKLGHYNHELGGLDSPITNQRFFQRVATGWEDATDKFQRKRDDEWIHST